MLARRPGKALAITFVAFAVIAIVGLILLASTGNGVAGFFMMAGLIGFLITGFIIFATVPRT